jgi:predicted protein tyrosine phosphatase
MPTEPFQIYQIAGFNAGMLGLCKQPVTDADFVMIKTWRPNVVLTLTNEEEFPKAIKSLPQQFLEADYNWLHLPVIDFGAPDAHDKALWQETLEQLLDILNAGGRVLIHCKGGNGRSGMVLLKLQVMQGEGGKDALARLRAVRAGAVETDAQYRWATIPL